MNMCPECDNMLYLKIKDADDVLLEELEEASKSKKQKKPSVYLQYFCRKCGYTTTKQTGNCVYKNMYNFESTTYKSKVNKYMCYDRTLPVVTNLDCPNSECPTNTQKEDKRVLYQQYDENNLKFIYVCCVCDHKWRNS